MTIINKLIILADVLDQQNLKIEADLVDFIIQASAYSFQGTIEPECLDFDDLPEDEQEKATEMLEKTKDGNN